MSDKQTIRAALYLAVQWEQSLAGCWGEGTPERDRSLKAVEKYKNLRARMFPGSERDFCFAEGPMVSIHELIQAGGGK